MISLVPQSSVFTHKEDHGTLGREDDLGAKVLVAVRVLGPQLSPAALT